LKIAGRNLSDRGMTIGRFGRLDGLDAHTSEPSL
jgi:hypothetical protein